MTFPFRIFGVAALVMACFAFAMPLHAEISAKQERRLKLLDMLNQEDERSFTAAISRAMDCSDSGDFNCARDHLEEARKYINTQEQKQRLRIAQQSLDASIEQVQKEREIARQIEREKQELERRERERQAEWEREQERLAQEADDYDPYSRSRGWATVLEISDAYTEAMTEKNRQRQKQIQNQQDIRAAQEEMAARQRQESQQRAAQYERNRKKLERRLEAERQAFRRKQEQRRREAQRTLQQASSGNRTREPVHAGATSMSGGPATSSSASHSSDSGSGVSSKKQKVYEPMPEIQTGENDTWFGDRSLAVAYSRLGAVNDLRDQCRNKGARSDSISFKQVKQGDTPGRWTYANPDCRQNGNDKWKCRAEVRTHCYRMQ